MKPSYHKLCHELLKNKAHTPRSMTFQFKSAGIAAEDFQAQIDFFDHNRVFFI